MDGKAQKVATLDEVKEFIEREYGVHFNAEAIKVEEGRLSIVGSILSKADWRKIKAVEPGDPSVPYRITVLISDKSNKVAKIAMYEDGEAVIEAIHAPDTTAPKFKGVTPEVGEVKLAHDATFVLTVAAEDENLYELEVDHSFEGILPEFSVYASEENPYGTDELKEKFTSYGVEVTYDAKAQKWTIDFGEAITSQIVEKGGITFYLVIKDQVGNEWGSMNPPTLENTFTYTVIQDAAPDTIAPEVLSIKVMDSDGEEIEEYGILSGEVTFGVTASDDKALQELQMDIVKGSLKGVTEWGILQQLNVYADENDPVKNDATKQILQALGVNVEYKAEGEASGTWTIKVNTAVATPEMFKEKLPEGHKEFVFPNGDDYSFNFRAVDASGNHSEYKDLSVEIKNYQILEFKVISNVLELEIEVD